MGWAIGLFNGRDIGYGVPATCDHPACGAAINRGLSYVCGGHVYGGENGCGLFFCGEHLGFAERHGDPVCARCATEDENVEPFNPTPDTQEWIDWKLTDDSWSEWRAENPEWVASNGSVSPAGYAAEGVVSSNTGDPS